MKTVTLQISGQTLVLGPLLAATIRDNKEAIRASRNSELAPDEFIDLACALALGCAKRVNPEVQLEHIQSLVDVENAGTVFQACWGITQPESRPGEPVAVVSPQT